MMTISQSMQWVSKIVAEDLKQNYVLSGLKFDRKKHTLFLDAGKNQSLLRILETWAHQIWDPI